ncbi:reverse transcriptase domain-containing protein [Tanacetum coccineum]
MVGGKSFNMEHKLNEYKHVKPIKQKRCGLGSDRNEASCIEVEELTKAGILQKVKTQTWVANQVMVKKSDKKWRMCVDFTGINKACPKDGYPLPEIEWNVESLSGFRLKCFLDAYKSYHQIQMAKEDEDKTTFFAGKEEFCYRKMPFRLNNAGATYQRLVDKVFGDQIRRNLEAYVNDMVIKSTSEEDILHDIQETFDRFRAKPSKVKEVTDLEPPRMLKEIQSLNGKLAALTRFLSKGAKKSLPFFKALKSCTDKKTIQWTTDAEEAFRRLKELVEILPTLTAPIKGEVLVMYLAASVEIISVVLLVEREERQVPIYFIPKDFFIKMPPQEGEKVVTRKVDTGKEGPKLENIWKLYTDGASSSDGSGAGLILISHEGKEYTYALRFKFKTTNNEAEYEALLAGQPTIKHYLEKVKEVLKGFDTFTIEHVRRNQNKKADALSKLASMTFEHLTKEVLVEVLAKRSINEKEVSKVEAERGEN